VRIWSLHPRYLDRQGLVACWRETLLAQAVLDGRTAGYRSHPQLQRFREQPEPIAAVGAYLAGLRAEATARGYRFDGTRILVAPSDAAEVPALPVTTGQLDHEWRHLMRKLAARSPDRAAGWGRIGTPEPHPLFEVVPGPVAEWESTT
jgi:hypothetical protein